MADVNLTAEVRTEFGKGAARRIRREEKVPAVIYGHGTEPVHITLPSYDVMMALKTSNVLMALDIGGRTELVIPKAVQREAIRGFLVHLDLLVVKKGETVTVEIPLQAEGELAPGGGLLEFVRNTLTVDAEATAIPDFLTVSVAGLEPGVSIYAQDIPLPSGTVLAATMAEDEVIIQITQPQAEEPDADAEESSEG